MKNRRKPPSRRSNKSRPSPPNSSSRSRTKRGYSRDRRRPQRPGRPGGGTTSTFPWQWVAVGAGGLILITALFLGGRALFGGGASPTSVPTPIARSTATSTTVQATKTLTPTQSPTPEAEITAPNIPALQQYMLGLINDDRRAEGLSELAWDSTAASAGTRHAQEMARFEYLSHWNLEGYGPDHRYSLIGGTNYVMENVYYYTQTVGFGPTSAEQWQDRIRRAQQNLMDSSGHRDNILAPEHTHVGVGIAYDEANGWLAVAQEFINRYVALNSPAAGGTRVALGDSVTVAGRLESGASNPLLALAYEPFPESMSVTELRKTSTYVSPAENYETFSLTLDADQRFDKTVSLNHGDQPGLYHVRIFVDVETLPDQIPAVDVVIWVE